jgi:exopolysaccharide biosynthesis WecB/TagA/CpsF family protein
MKIDAQMRNGNILSKNRSKFAGGQGEILSARLCTFLNPYSYWILRSRRDDILDRFDVIGVDGMLLCAFLRWTGIAHVPRLSFDMTSIARDVFEMAQNSNRRVFLIGANAGEIEVAIRKIKLRYSKLHCAGFHHGYFSEDERSSIFDQIISAGADIVVCGMGAPKQEEFLRSLTESGWAGQGYSCGGFIRQIATGDLEYYPKWIDKLNLRWAYRIWDEPKLLKRYFIQYPIAISVFVHDALYAHSLKGPRET